MISCKLKSAFTALNYHVEMIFFPEKVCANNMESYKQ